MLGRTNQQGKGFVRESLDRMHQPVRRRNRPVDRRTLGSPHRKHGREFSLIHHLTCAVRSLEHGIQPLDQFLTFRRSNSVAKQPVSMIGFDTRPDRVLDCHSMFSVTLVCQVDQGCDPAQFTEPLSVPPNGVASIDSRRISPGAHRLPVARPSSCCSLAVRRYTFTIVVTHRQVFCSDCPVLHPIKATTELSRAADSAIHEARQNGSDADKDGETALVGSRFQ